MLESDFQDVLASVRPVFELGYTMPALRSMFDTNNGIAGHVLIEGGTPAQRHDWTMSPCRTAP
ncbi:MAG: hypothetical protein ACR2G2_10400 [Pseudonocardia sp.]